MIENIQNLTIAAVDKLFRDRQLKPTELTEAYFARIEEKDKEINSYIKVLKDEALESARESEQRFENNSSKGLLDGIPIAIKDNICTQGIETTAASKILQGFIPPYDATVITKLKEAGAVILGKTNMDEFAMGSSTETSIFGPTKNPHDTTRVPGGSSGGSAAAVAANLCLGALGSDTGGSIRQPASFCGVVGFKPTYGAVSRYGLMAMASSLDQIGPLAKTVEDAEIIFKVITGYDEKDSTSIAGNPKSEIRNPPLGMQKVENLKIGVPKEYFGEGLNPEVKKVVEEAIQEFKKLGAEIKEISLPNSKYALSCYYIIMPVEVASNLSRYDGIKYGYSSKDAQNLIETYIKSRSQGFGNEAKRRIILGTYTSSAGYIDQYYNKAQKVRNLIRQDFEKAFEGVDFILGPVTPEVAFKIGQKSDPLTMYLSDIYTIAVNLAGLPAISVPCGNVDPPVGGLPVGLQIIGPKFSDSEIFEISKKYEGARDGTSA